MRRLLLATDGSPAANQAARFAGRLASRSDGRIDVVSVVPERSISTTAWLGMAPEVPVASVGPSSALAEAERISRHAASEARQGGCREVREAVEIGEPARTIVAIAERGDADAIVMGRRGTGNVSGFLLGSVSTKVSHLTDRTVITVRGDDIEIDRIVVAVDGSDHATRAIDLGIALAKAFEADLDLLHVVSLTALVPFGIGGVDNFEYGRLEDTMRAEGERYLELAKKHVGEEGLDATMALEVGDPASRIVHHAFDAGADVICIGRRGLGNVKGLLLGSVSHKVAHIAEQTVVTVR